MISMTDFTPEKILGFSIAGDLSILRCFISLFAAFVLSFILALVYKRTHKRQDDCHSIMCSMIFIAVILAGAMMVIGNNLAIAFGLVGAVSIIRFRTAVSSFLDMSFIFATIIVGMASGLGFYYLAAIITFFVGFLMLILNHFKFGMSPPSYREYEITLTINDSDLTEEALYDIVSSAGKNPRFLEYKIADGKKKFRFALFISAKSQMENFEKALCEEFKDLKFQLSITLR